MASNTFKNDKPFIHKSRYGTSFRAGRCDFQDGVVVTCRAKDPVQLASDVAEMIGFHATLIHPDLNGFSGYDCIDFQFR